MPYYKEIKNNLGSSLLRVFADSEVRIN